MLRSATRHCLPPDTHSSPVEIAAASGRTATADTPPHYIFVDYVKCIGIILIVYGHLDVSDFERCVLWTFHVPLFFVMSGFLTQPNHTPLNVRQKARRLLLPYIYIYLITTCILSVLTLLETHTFESAEFVQTLLGMFWGNAAYSHFPNAPLWFLPSLFTVELIFGLYATRLRWAMIAIPIASAVLYTHGIVDTFMSFDLSLLGLNYFAFGYCLRASGIVHRLRAVPLTWLILLGAAMFVPVVWIAASGNVWYEGNSMRAYFVSFVGGVIGSLMIVILGIACERCFGEVQIVSFISKNTLLILGFHFLSNKFVKDIFEGAGYDPSFLEMWHLSPLFTLAHSIVSILLLMPFIMAINRYCPQIGGRRPQTKAVCA